jgi:hypothetical protein
MPTDVLKLVESVLAEKTAVATKERELISNLNRVLPDMGYRVVPIDAQASKSESRVRRGRLIRPRGKPLVCPQCPRTFAHPLHLGRHMSATHGAKLGETNGVKVGEVDAAKRRAADAMKPGALHAKRGPRHAIKRDAAHGAKRARRAPAKARAKRKRS